MESKAKSSHKITQKLFNASPFLIIVLLTIAVFAVSTSNLVFNIQAHHAFADVEPQYESVMTKNELGLLFNNSSPILGSKDAPIIMIEFGDYQCFYCNKFYRTIEPDIVKNYIDTGKVRMVFKDFVIIGQDSVNAANAAHCAQDQGKFWIYHDALYDNWSGENTGWASSDNLLKFAKQIGLDEHQFNQCMAQSKYLVTIQSSLSNAKDLGLNTTPVFFIVTPDRSVTKIVGVQPYDIFDNVFRSKNETDQQSTNTPTKIQKVSSSLKSPELFQKIISKPENFDTNDANKLVYKAKAYSDSKLYVDAFNYYDKALSIDHVNTEAREGKDAIYNQLASTTNMLYDTDLKLGNSPDDQTALDTEGLLFASIGRHDLALSYFEKDLQSHPADLNALGAELGSLFILDKNQEFLDRLKPVLSLAPNGEFNPFLSLKSIALYKLGKYEEAINTYDEFLKTIPQPGDSTYSQYMNNIYSPYITRSVMLENIGKSQDANFYYDLYRQQDYQNNFYFDKGTTLMLLDKYQDAISNFDKVPTTSPNYEKAGYLKVIAYDKIANSLSTIPTTGIDFLDEIIQFFKSMFH